MLKPAVSSRKILNIYFYFLMLFSFISVYPQYDSLKNLEKFHLAQNYYQKAIASYSNKDYQSYLTNIKQTLLLRPNHPTILYNTASAYSLLDSTDKALDLLKRIADMGLVYPVESDTDFIPLQTIPEFSLLKKKFAENKLITGNPTKVFSVPDKFLITEGLAYNPNDSCFYLSVINKRKIIKYNQNDFNDFNDFINQGENYISGVFGLKVDSKKNLLWASSSPVPQMDNYSDSSKYTSAIYLYDLKSQKFIKDFKLYDTLFQHVFGDFIIGRNGTIFISDSKGRSIYKINDPDSNSIEQFIPSDIFISPQGITLSPDEKYLFLSDYSQGIFRIETTSQKIEKLKTPENICLLGIDGIYFYMNSLIAIQNGIIPNRVMRIYLNDELNHVTGQKILAANHPSMNDPTLGLICKDQFFFIANSQWENISDDGTLASEEKWENPVILKVKLE